MVNIIKKHRRNIIIVAFVIILNIEFYIYFSEYDLVMYLTIPISIATAIFSLFLIHNRLKNQKIKVLFSGIIILFTIIFFLWEYILACLGNANEISETWNIDKFEIQSIRRSFNEQEPSFYTLKEVYCYGLIHKEMDISFPEKFVNHDNKCVLKFVDVNMTFDLCNLKQQK